MQQLQESVAIDWSDCPLVEVNPEKVSGVPILKHTRVQADSIVENFEDGSTVEEIADDFDIPENIIREVLAYAARQDPSNQAITRRDVILSEAKDLQFA